MNSALTLLFFKETNTFPASSAVPEPLQKRQAAFAL